MSRVRPNQTPPPSYGELAARSFHLIDQATLHGCGPFATRQHADNAILGYERLLGVVGRHLQLLAAPGLVDLDKHQVSLEQTLPELIRRLTRLDITTSTESLWCRAADRLAVTHDLLATHIGPFGAGLTPDSAVLADPAIREAATTRLLAATLPPLAASGALLANATHEPLGRLSRRQTVLLEHHAPQVRKLIEDILLRDQPVSRPEATLVALDGLNPASQHLVNAVAARSEFEHSLSALEVLRLISFRQVSGEQRASPGSLRDLALVAQHATDATGARLSTPSTPLGRVRRAAALDTLQTAGATWNNAGAAIGPQIRGLDRAPRMYADAVQVLRDRAAAEPKLLAAVMAALPRLGNDAATTIEGLVTNRRLVVGARPPGRLQVEWRPLNPDEGYALAEKFADAGRASRQATTTLKALNAEPSAAGTIGGRAVDAPSVTRQRELPAPGPAR